jgi:hypothetical protein
MAPVVPWPAAELGPGAGAAGPGRSRRRRRKPSVRSASRRATNRQGTHLWRDGPLGRQPVRERCRGNDPKAGLMVQGLAVGPASTPRRRSRPDHPVRPERCGATIHRGRARHGGPVPMRCMPGWQCSRLRHCPEHRSWPAARSASDLPGAGAPDRSARCLGPGRYSRRAQAQPVPGRPLPHWPRSSGPGVRCRSRDGGPAAGHPPAGLAACRRLCSACRYPGRFRPRRCGNAHPMYRRSLT